MTANQLLLVQKLQHGHRTGANLIEENKELEVEAVEETKDELEVSGHISKTDAKDCAFPVSTEQTKFQVSESTNKE